MVSIQEYDFDVQHIKGVDNKVADAFSRLCGIQEINQIAEESVPRGGEHRAPIPKPSVIGADTFNRLCGIREVTRSTQEGVPRGGKRKAPTPETYVRGEDNPQG